MDLTNQVTYDVLFKLLTPVLITIIGMFIRNGVNNISYGVSKLEKRFEEHVKNIEKILSENQKISVGIDNRLVRLETITDLKIQNVRED